MRLSADRSDMPGEDLRVELPVGVESPRRGRHAARDWCGNCGLSKDACEIVILLLSELVSNSVQHSGSDETPIEVDASLVGHTVRVVVSDGGRGFARRAPDPSSPGGYGLLLLDAQATRWGISRNGRTRVWFEVDLGLAADGAGLPPVVDRARHPAGRAGVDTA